MTCQNPISVHCSYLFVSPDPKILANIQLWVNPHFRKPPYYDYIYIYIIYYIVYTYIYIYNPAKAPVLPEVFLPSPDSHPPKPCQWCWACDWLMLDQLHCILSYCKERPCISNQTNIYIYIYSYCIISYT